jgi:hypothetical protein
MPADNRAYRAEQDAYQNMIDNFPDMPGRDAMIEKFKERQLSSTRSQLLKTSDYLMGPQRRGEILGQNFRAANLQRGGLNEGVASLASKGITNPGMVSRFNDVQERSLAGSAFTAANQTSSDDLRQGAGILQNVYGADVQDQRIRDERKANKFGIGDLFGLAGSTILGAVTGGVGGALGAAAFGGMKKFFGGGGGSQFAPSDPTSNWEPEGGYQSGDYSSFKWG